MRLTTITNMSLDGVTQGHRRIDVGDDGDGDGYERFGWAPPLLDDEASEFISEAFQRADAFLFGRRTYEIFAGSWGAGMDPGNPVGEAMNSRPKYVVSTTLTDPQWAHPRLCPATTWPRRSATSRPDPAASSRCGAAAP